MDENLKVRNSALLTSQDISEPEMADALLLTKEKSDLGTPPFSLPEDLEDIFREESFIKTSYFELEVQCRRNGYIHRGKLLRLPSAKPVHNPMQQRNAKEYLSQLLSSENPESIKYAESCSAFPYTYLCKHISDEDMRVHTLFAFAAVLCDDISEKFSHTYSGSTSLVNVFQALINVLKGKVVQEPNSYSDFNNFSAVCQCLIQIRTIFLKRQLNILHVIEAFELSLNAFHKEYSFLKPEGTFSSNEYMEIKKLTAGVDFFCTLCYTFDGVNLTNIKHISEYKQFIECARKISRLGFDIPSFYSDINSQGGNDNYILVKQREENWTLNESFLYTMNLQNKLILKMIGLKYKIEKNKALVKSTPDLLPAVKIVLEYSQSCMDHVFISKKYQEEAIITATPILTEMSNCEQIQKFVSQ